MKRSIKKIICFVLIVLSFTGLISGKQVMAGTSAPSSTWNLRAKKDGKYKGSGSCNSVDLYSNYKFTGVSKMKISVTNKSKKKNIKVKVYKDKWLDSCVSTVTIPPNGNTTWAVSTSSSKKYFLRFFKPAEFSWSIKEG